MGVCVTLDPYGNPAQELELALKLLRRKLMREGTMSAIKRHQFHLTRGQRRRAKRAAAQRRAR